ncbi:hypothetical protein GH733_000467 [Mirounga leonina]|nr:hypothetical protein GH733_000467 [Mirounga leonina]
MDAPHRESKRKNEVAKSPNKCANDESNIEQHFALVEMGQTLICHGTYWQLQLLLDKVLLTQHADGSCLQEDSAVLETSLQPAVCLRLSTMPSIKLQSSNGEIFEVDVEIAKQSIWEWIEGDDDPVPLPNVNAAILKKVIQWCTHHKDYPPPPEDDENEEKRTDDIPVWDQEFLKTLNIKNDFTEEEEARVCKENQWCEEKCCEGTQGSAGLSLCFFLKETNTSQSPYFWVAFITICSYVIQSFVYCSRCIAAHQKDAQDTTPPFPGAPSLISEQESEMPQPLKFLLGFILDVGWPPLLCFLMKYSILFWQESCIKQELYY